GADVRELAARRGQREAHEIVKVQQARVVVAPLESKGFRDARQQQALRRPVRTDEEQRLFGRQCREDDRLNRIEAIQTETRQPRSSACLELRVGYRGGGAD